MSRSSTHGVFALAALAASSLASAVTISGTTVGLFSNNSATALDGLTYVPNTTGFSVQSTGVNSGSFTIGGTGTAHLGQFQLAPSNFTYDGSSFTLRINFTSPAGAGSQTFPAVLTGQVTSTLGGGANVDFDGPRTFAVSGGSLTLQVNSISLSPGQGLVPITARGSVQVVPEPASLVAIAMGTFGLAARRRRRA